MIHSRIFANFLRLFLLLSLLIAPQTARSEDNNDPKRPEKLILGDMIGDFGTKGMNWQANWKADNAGKMTLAADQAIKVATHPELNRERLLAEFKYGGEAVKAASRNLDIGRHDLMKVLFAKASERANDRLAKEKLMPLARVATVNSGGTGNFVRDVDITAYGGDEVREKYLFEALMDEAKANNLKVQFENEKIGIKAGIRFPQLDVAIHCGANDLPDPRFASDVQVFAANYRNVIEMQAKNPDAYFGYGFDVEVAGRRSLFLKPGQTLVQEFICEPGKPVKYQGQIAASQREVRAILRGTVVQRYRRAQNASYMANNYLQAFRHEHGKDPDPTTGALKYAGRTIEALCAYHGMKPWPELMPSDRMVVIKSLFPPGYGNTPNQLATMEHMMQSVDVAYQTFIGKAVPKESAKNVQRDKDGKVTRNPMTPEEMSDHAKTAQIFMNKAVGSTASAVAQEMLEPPAFDQKFLAERAGANWDMMNAQQRAKFAQETDSNYKKCCSIAAMENLLCMVQQVRQMDLPEYNTKGNTPGKEALRHMLDSADERTRPILELAIEHAEAAVQLDSGKDPVRRLQASAKLKECRQKLEQLTGAPSAGNDVIKKASDMTADGYIDAKRANRPTPLSEGYSELKTRFIEHIEEAFPPTDLAALRAHINEVGVKNYMVNKMVHEFASPATALDIITLIEIYQNGGGKKELFEAAGMSLVNRGHWAIGFLIQAGNVTNEKELNDLGKNIVFDALARLTPGAMMFKIAFDIEKGLVNITVGYEINQLNADLIDALYTGEAGRVNNDAAGSVAGRLRDSGFCILEGKHVIRETNEKTGVVSINIHRPVLYMDYFKQCTGRDYDDKNKVINEKKQNNLTTKHDALVRMLNNQGSSQEPSWFGETTTIKPSEEQLQQALTDYYKALEIFARPAAQKVLAESAVREYIKDGKDVIEEGLVSRFTQDLVLGTVATWQTRQVERVDAKRGVEAIANFADMNQLAKAIFESNQPRKGIQPEYSIEVGVTGASLQDDLDGSAPIPFRFVLHGNGEAPADAPNFAFEVETGLISPPADGKEYQSREHIKQSFKVSAITEDGKILARTDFTASVILPKKDSALTLKVYEGKDEDGKLSTKYTYYDAKAVQESKIRPKTEYKTDGNKVYHGKFTEYDSKGRLDMETTYDFGRKNGVQRKYLVAGDKHYLAGETTFNKDKQVKHVTFYPDGTRNFEMEYDEQEHMTACTLYWGSADQQVMEKSTYSVETDNADARKGTFVAYWKNGTVRIKSDFRNVSAIDLVSGDNIESCRNGPWERNFENGAARERGQTEKGLKVGSWSYGDAKGNPTAKITYGKKQEILEEEKWEYTKEDKLLSYTHNKEGKKTGQWIENFENGNLKEKTTYEDNVENGPYAKGNEKGVLTIKGKYDNGLQEGLWETRSDDGVLSSETTYSGGKKEGPYVSYHSNGKAAVKSAYKNDLEDGKREMFRLDGTMEESGSYVKGLKEGLWVTYDKKGKRSSWEEYKKGERVKSGSYEDEKK